MTRVELAEQIVKLLREQPMTSYELNAHFDCSADAVTGALGDLRRGGTVQLLGSTWRLLPGGASHSLPAPVSAAAPVRPAPRPTFAVNSSDVFFERPVVDEEPEPVAPEPAEAAPQPEPPEPVEIAKTKVCNTCEERKPLNAYTVNRATPDGLSRRCKACDVEHRNSRKKAHEDSSVVNENLKQITRAAEAAIAAKVEVAIAAEPAPLLHAAPAIEVSNTRLDVTRVIGAVVITQSAEVDGRNERQALLIPRADLRSLIDQLTRLV